jgi:carboxypeptidase family protein
MEALMNQRLYLLLVFAVAFCTGVSVFGQSLGSAGTVGGIVVDPAGGVIRGATVEIENVVTGFRQTTSTDDQGSFRFSNVPPNPYHLHVSAPSFKALHQDVTVRSSVPLELKIQLEIGVIDIIVDVEAGAGGMVENVPSAHTDVAKSLLEKLPVSSPGSGLSDAVMMTAPGVAADSNGFFHPLGDHAQTTVAVDGQPISDQQSKAFSTQIPINALQSMEVMTGAVPAEFGDKTSLVVNSITRSGLGQHKPTGSFATRYGTFGTVGALGDLSMGGDNVGNFTAFNFERSGRFLDAPEFDPLHDRGKAVNLFNRFDYKLTPNDTFHFNLFLARNRFEIPNTIDQEALGQDQQQLVRTLNIAPGYVHTFSSSTLLTFNPYYRVDQVWFYPSPDPFSDQPQTFNQQRRLTNAGARADLSYVKGIHNIKIGGQFYHTFLTENFQFGITDPAFNDPATEGFLPGLAPFDLTRGGQLFSFHGHTDVKQEAAYAQDTLSLRQLTLSLGLRFDNYNGISHGHGIQPRVGISYHLKPTNTVLRGSYTRTFETPYNENLILSSATGAGGLADGSLGPASNEPLKPGRRNQYNLGLQQGIGKFVIVDADYFWKFTRNAYDFASILNTPVAFPISWDKSKIDGVSLRVNLANFKGFSAFFAAGHTRARYFPPESGGLFFNSDLPEGVFRIDHDQAFQQNVHVQYQFDQLGRIKPYVGLSWRYDSGLVAGSVPDYATALSLTPDQQAQIGLFCGGVMATPKAGLTECTDPNRGALRLRIPADGTAQDDHNPPRITPRHLFDLTVGTDNLLRTDHTRLTLRLMGINLTNKNALYNFLSTFSGTHFVTPRSFQFQLGVTF